MEKGMITHSSDLAWEIPWTEEPGRLQSMGSQRVGQDQAHIAGFPDDASGKEPTCQRRRHKRCGFETWVRRIPWWRAW